MQGHGFTRRPRNLKGNIRGGMAAGCTGCSWMTVGGSVPSLLKAHYDYHARDAVATPAASAASLSDELAELGARLTAVTDGD